MASADEPEQDKVTFRLTVGGFDDRSSDHGPRGAVRSDRLRDGHKTIACRRRNKKTTFVAAKFLTIMKAYGRGTRAAVVRLRARDPCRRCVCCSSRTMTTRGE